MYRQLIAVTLWLLCFSYGQSQDLRVATFNMRYDNSKDTLNPWEDRLPIIARMIEFYDFDVFGGQELLHHQVEGLEKNLPGYAFHGVGRDDGSTKGEYSPVFYKKDKFRVLKAGNFWLSETPEKPGKGWDAALPRICSWIHLEDKASGLKFYFFNTHFDHRGVQARRNSVLLILEQVKKIAGDSPVILTGDFNFDQRHENYGLINSSDEFEDSYVLAGIRLATNGTFNGFDITSKTDKRIDHIFVTDSFKVTRYGILTDSYLGKFPSDHFPVMVELSVKGKK